ncbi:sulfur carrier protein ThiS [Leptospira semungkisensis]|uniref:Sulfur carrier protein ThiS n=1 Tax=Leptospira semungkisensis TaxID=2484985 RepID=A0A4V3JB23_9LEPT|nr:sulfur carrier protein ThiS [Leptospira semungkisensis]TGK00659.1 sulfur carrier protein ThiS [Leptospira semungkisensis]
MKVNGRDLLLDELSSPSVFALLEALRLKPETVAIQKNGEILKRDTWSGIILNQEDKIEILKFVGGG